MPTTVSRGVYRHGKRHRFEATTQDDSREAFKAALDELDEKVRAFTEATTPKVARQSYRKRKGSFPPLIAAHWSTVSTRKTAGPFTTHCGHQRLQVRVPSGGMKVTYSATIGDNAEFLRRTITRVADFSGRSSRTEVIWYWIASVLISAVINFTVMMFASFEALILTSLILNILILIPMFALFVRRIHDQDKSGWWGALLPALVLLGLPGALAEIDGDVFAAMAARSTHMDLASGVLGLFILVLFLWPGTEGSNSHGADPRLE